MQIAGQLAGRAGAKLARLLGMPVSHYTLLRLLMREPDKPIPTPKVLGVDDWAMKKGHRDADRLMALFWLISRSKGLLNYSQIVNPIP